MIKVPRGYFAQAKLSRFLEFSSSSDACLRAMLHNGGRGGSVALCESPRKARASTYSCSSSTSGGPVGLTSAVSSRTCEVEEVTCSDVGGRVGDGVCAVRQSHEPIP
eukprot:6141180-Pyramimonas_sp.AAC.1